MGIGQKVSSMTCKSLAPTVFDSPSPPLAPMVPIPTSDSSDTIAMSSNPVIQLPEDQFLHHRKDLEKKEDEQTRQMRELQGRAEHLQHLNDRLQA